MPDELTQYAQLLQQAWEQKDPLEVRLVDALVSQFPGLRFGPIPDVQEFLERQGYRPEDAARLLDQAHRRGQYLNVLESAKIYNENPAIRGALTLDRVGRLQPTQEAAQRGYDLDILLRASNVHKETAEANPLEKVFVGTLQGLRGAVNGLLDLGARLLGKGKELDELAKIGIRPLNLLTGRVEAEKVLIDEASEQALGSTFWGAGGQSLGHLLGVLAVSRGLPGGGGGASAGLARSTLAGAARIGAAEALLTPGGVQPRSAAGLVGSMFAGVGGLLDTAVARYVLPIVSRKVATWASSAVGKGLVRPEQAKVLVHAVVPNVLAQVGNSVAFGGIEAARNFVEGRPVLTPEGEIVLVQDFNLLTAFAHNLFAFGVLGLGRTAVKAPAFFKVGQEGTPLAQVFPGVAAQDALAESLGKTIQRAGIAGKLQGIDPNDFMSLAVEQMKKSQQVPPHLLALGARLAEMGVALTPDEAVKFSADYEAQMDLAASRWGVSVMSQGGVLRLIREHTKKQALQVDPVLTTPLGLKLATDPSEAPISFSEIAGLFPEEKATPVMHAWRRFMEARERRDALALQVEKQLGVTADAVKLGRIDLLDFQGRFLQDLVDVYESQGVIGKPTIATERFIAKMPKLSDRARTLLESASSNVSESFALSALRMVAQGSTPIASVDQGRLFYLRQALAHVRSMARLQGLSQADLQSIVAEVQAASREALERRRLPDRLLVFRAGEPIGPETTVTLDPRVALAHDWGNYNALAAGATLTKLAEGGRAMNDVRAYVVPKAAVLADVDVLHAARRQQLLSELHVPTNALTPIAEIKLPLSDDRQLIPFMPSTWKALSRVARADQELQRAAANLNAVGVPVVTAANRTQLRFVFQANPVTGDVLAKIAPATEAGAQVLQAIQRDVDGMLKDPQAFIEGVFLADPKIQRYISRKAKTATEQINWLRFAVNWANQPVDSRGPPPAAPSSIKDPLALLGTLRAAYGSNLEKVLLSVENVMGPGTAGRVALLAKDPAHVDEAVKAAVAAGSLIPPDAAASMTTHASRLEINVRDIPHPSELAGVVKLPELRSRMEELVKTAQKVYEAVADFAIDREVIKELGDAMSFVFPLPPNLVRRELFQSAVTAIPALMARISTGSGQVLWEADLGLRLSTLAMHSLQVDTTLKGSAKMFASQLLREVELFHDQVRKAAKAPDAAEAAVADSWLRIAMALEGRNGELPDGQLRPPEATFALGVKRLFQEFEDAMAVLGIRPRPQIGPFFPHMIDVVQALSGDEVPDAQLSKLRQAYSDRFKPRTRLSPQDLQQFALDFNVVLERYISSVSRALAYRPLTVQIKNILETFGTTGPKIETRQLGYRLSATVPHEPISGLPPRTVKFLLGMADRAAGRIPNAVDRFVRGVVGTPLLGLIKAGRKLLGVKDELELDAAGLGSRAINIFSTAVFAIQLGGVQLDQLIRNLTTGGIIAFWDRGLGPKVLFDGAEKLVIRDPETGVGRINPLVEKILGEPHFMATLVRQVDEGSRRFQEGWLQQMGKDAVKFLTAAFTLSEVGVRGATALGAYHHALAKGSSEPEAIAFARFAAMRTQTNYDSIVGAPFFAGEFGRMVGQFQRFGWNYLDVLSQHTWATGLMGKDRAAAARFVQSGPMLYRKPVIYDRQLPAFDAANGLRLAGGLVGLAAFALTPFVVGQGFHWLFGVDASDLHGVFSTAPDAVRHVVRFLVDAAVSTAGPSKIPDKVELTREITQFLGADVPVGTVASIVEDSIGPLPALLGAGVDAVLSLYRDPAKYNELEKSFRILEPRQLRKVLEAYEADREGFVRSRDGSRVFPAEGQTLSRLDRLRLYLGFTPADLAEERFRYRVAADTRDAYFDKLAFIDSEAREDLRRGVDPAVVQGRWLAAIQELQDLMGYAQSAKTLLERWNRLRKQDDERSEKTVRERLEEVFPLAPPNRR